MATFLKLVIRAVGAFAGDRPLVEVDGRDRRAIQDDGDLGALGRDRHVIPLASGLLGVDLGCDQAVEGTRIAEPATGRVVEGDFDAGANRVVEITDAKKDAGVAALVQLVIEIELEVGELFLIDDQIAARAMRVEAVSSGYETLAGAFLLQSIQPLVLLPSKIVWNSSSNVGADAALPPDVLASCCFVADVGLVCSEPSRSPLQARCVPRSSRKKMNQVNQAASTAMAATAAIRPPLRGIRLTRARATGRLRGCERPAVALAGRSRGSGRGSERTSMIRSSRFRS